MKAWRVSNDTYEGTFSKIVFAETNGKAKSMCAYDEELGEPEFIDMRCQRLPWADKMQNYSESEIEIERVKRGEWFYKAVGDSNVIFDEKSLPLLEQYHTISGVFNAYDAGAIDYDFMLGKFINKEPVADD